MWWVCASTLDLHLNRNCVLLTDLFPHFYTADLIDLVKRKERHLARSFNLTFRYINVVLSLNNSRDFGDYLRRIHPKRT